MVNRGTGAARTGTGVSSAAPGDRETVCQVRHPRYLQLLLALLGWSLMANPLGAYRACALDSGGMGDCAAGGAGTAGAAWARIRRVLPPSSPVHSAEEAVGQLQIISGRAADVAHLPALAEQQEIVRRVEGLFALADQLELRLAQARGQVDQLTPSLLARAFAGKLVPQDPTDEPASKLLERIKGKGINEP